MPFPFAAFQRLSFIFFSKLFSPSNSLHDGFLFAFFYTASLFLTLHISLYLKSSNHISCKYYIGDYFLLALQIDFREVYVLSNLGH
jgi:hypothetical protein